MKYTTEADYIIELLKYAITDGTPSLPPTSLDWNIIYKIAKRHRILSILYFGITKLPKDFQRRIPHFDSYVLSYKHTLVLDANRSFELDNLKSDFDSHHIDYVFLKGSVSKYLYPDTSMRVMSDIDLFYRGAFHDVHNIFIKNGYQLLNKKPKETVYGKNINHVKVEAQTHLIDEGYVDWYDYLSNPWDKYKRVQNSHEYKMTNEDFYIYHIIHMAKHFIHGGIGLIHMLDTYIMLKAYEDLNFDYINNELKKLGLNVFHNNIRLLVYHWFEDKALSKHDKQTEKMLKKYIFNSGAFGVATQRYINDAVEKGEAKISFLRKVFPDKNTMVDYYGSTLKKHPALIPFYWIRLNLKRVFKDGKKTRSSLQNIGKITDKRIAFTIDLMKRCGF